ncbi:MAG: MBG domain-containing protein, partial [Chitinophagaceae bacterium]
AITQQPQGGIICQDGSLVLSVTTTGHQLTYEWKRGAQVVGTNAATYTATQPGDYTVTVSGSCGMVTSNVATVTQPITTITSEPAGGGICAGQTRLLTVAATGQEPLTYQWYKNGLTLNGAITNEVIADDTATYNVIVTGFCGSDTSALAVVTLNPATQIRTQPSPQSITYGENTHFDVDAIGTGALRYRWEASSDGSSWNAIADDDIFSTTTLAAVNVSGPSVAMSGLKLKCTVTGLCDAATTDEVTLTINRAPLTVTANNKTKIYGEAIPQFEFAYNGFVKNEKAADVVFGNPGLTTAANQFSDVDEYDIIADSGSLTAANYAFTFKKGKLTILPKDLDVVAADQSKVFGDSLPIFTAIYNGFVKNGDSTLSDVQGEPVFETDADQYSDVADYYIEPKRGGLQSRNYALQFRRGKLVV